MLRGAEIVYPRRDSSASSSSGDLRSSALNILPLEQAQEIITLLTDRERINAVEAWKNASAEFRTYRGGTVRNNNGEFLYSYPSGENLIIDDELVMSSCEQPWSIAAIDFGFRELTRHKRGPFGVLELGFGQGFAARRAIQQLEIHRGWYDAVELNKNVYERAKNWQDLYNNAHKNMHSGLPGIYERPPIRIYLGDAAQALLTRARKIISGKEQKFDLILLDTYPIKPSDKGKGTHDLAFLSLVKACLKEDGIVVWYPYFPGFVGGITQEQESLIRKHFRSWGQITIPNEREGFPVEHFQIKPPPSYTYLYRQGNPIQELPIGYLRDPIRQF